MNYLIDFFESLKFDKIFSDIEFSTENEQLTITKGNKAYLFYFSKVPDIFRSNLCKEIMLITEDSADLKLDFNNQLADYLELKFKNKSVEAFIESKKMEYPEDFISQLEEKLTAYSNFNYIYLTLEMRKKYPEQKEIIKKTKV
jgi:hypothetical protein